MPKFELHGKVDGKVEVGRRKEGVRIGVRNVLAMEEFDRLVYPARQPHPTALLQPHCSSPVSPVGISRMSRQVETTATLLARDAAKDLRTDGDLARLAAGGNQQAAQVLIIRYERLVRSFLRKITGKPDTADDLAQETFVRLLKHAGSYDEKYPMRTWLLTIARRLSINHSKRADQQVGSTEYEGHRSDSDGPAAKIEAQDMKQVTRKMLDGALAQLSLPQREVMVLFHEQDLSIEQVAQVMEMPVGTIKSHLHRARAAMRKVLAPQLELIEL